MHIKILGQGDDFDVHAHKVILAAGSDTFRHELSFTTLEVRLQRHYFASHIIR